MRREHSTPCPNGTLVGSAAGALVLAPSRCKRWSCEHCGPRKARKLQKRIAATPARRLITLTARRNPHVSKLDQLDELNHAWRTIWKRIRRSQGPAARGYVRVVELTKNGTPHLHIAADCGYVPQRRLSAWMRELTGSPVVDVRAVKSSRGLARYLGKYLTKATETVENRRKWSATPSWLPPDEKPPLEPGELPLDWKWIAGDEDHVLTTYLVDGFIVAPEVAYLVLLEPS